VEWRSPHKEEFNDLHFSLIIIRLIKSRRISEREYMAYMGNMGGTYRVLVERLKGNRLL